MNIREDDSYVEVDDRFLGAKKILFDNNDVLWLVTERTVSRRVGDSQETLIENGIFGGSFNAIAVDSKNNIWTGGRQTGLIRIDAYLNVTQLRLRSFKRKLRIFAIRPKNPQIKYHHADLPDSLKLKVGYGLIG
jgi:hypothetical protein